MYWQEDTKERPFVVPTDVLDLAFNIECPTLPVDHAWLLNREICRMLPWFGENPADGLHIIHGAESGNGWERPQAADELLYLSRRVKLTLRLPHGRIELAETLTGSNLDVSGHSIRVGSAKRRKLGLTNFLYARYVVGPTAVDEDIFIDWAVAELRAMGLNFKKVLCGKGCQLERPGGALETRSLLVADLTYPDAVKLQEQGIGPHREMGCGLFLPQKSF